MGVTSIAYLEKKKPVAVSAEYCRRRKNREGRKTSLSAPSAAGGVQPVKRE
jgi:hypothetical protein